MNKSRRKSYLMLFMVVAALIVSYEYVLIGQWKTLIDLRHPPTYQHVKALFGPPGDDLGSGLHVYRYGTLLGHVMVGTPDNAALTYIRYGGPLSSLSGQELYAAGN